MKKSFVLVPLAMILLLSSCGPAQKVTSSWKDPSYQPKGYKKIFIAALVQNKNVKAKLEAEMSAAASSMGYQVVKSMDEFPPTFTKETAPTKEAIMDKVRELGCELIYTVTLTHRQSETRYVPGTAYAPFPGYGYGFGGYYGYWMPYAYDPGYYTTDRTYFMEGSLFEVSTEKLIWSVQTESYNPASIESFSQGLTQIMMEQAKKDLKVK